MKSLRRNKQQKESTQKLLQKKHENSFREQKVSVCSSMTKRSSPRLIITVLLGTNAKKKHKKHNHNKTMKVWKTQNRKKKDRFVGLPPNKRYCLTPLARQKVMESRIVIFGAQTISSPHHRFIRQSYFLSRKMLHALI